MFRRITSLIRAYFTLPSAIRLSIIYYYLHRISFTRPSDHQIIWTSFFYFYARQNSQIRSSTDGYRLRFVYRNKPLDVLIRKGKSSDVFVFFQVFIRDEYKPLFAKTDRLQYKIFDCLDAGANVGYFTLAMACWFDNCHIVSVEPDEQNYAILLKNIEINRLAHRVTPLKAALWTDDRPLTLINGPSLQEWAYSVTDKEAQGLACEGLSVNTLLGKMKLTRFHVVKIDVEGAEHALFTNEDFLLQISESDVVGVEIHGEGVQKEKILKALDNAGFDVLQQGELTLSVKRSKQDRDDE